MSLEQIAASALAGMETSTRSTIKEPNDNVNDDTNVVAAATTTAVNTTMQESSLNTNDSPIAPTNMVNVDTTVTDATTTTAYVPTEALRATGDVTKLDAVTTGTLTTHSNEMKVAFAIDPGSTADLGVGTLITGSTSNNNNNNASFSSAVINDNTTMESACAAVIKTNEETIGSSSGHKPKRRGPKPKVKFPTDPRLIQCIPKRKEYTNHTYSDFSMIPLDPNYVKPSRIEDMSFVEKIHDILSNPEYNNYISWKPNGRTFGIIIPTMFEKIVCPIYFQHKRYSSFLRQLNNHGFKHLTNEHGPNRNCYYHECFLRNMEYLCQYMPEPKDARRQIPDPLNEPNFDAISLLYPVPPPHLQQQLLQQLQQQKQITSFNNLEPQRQMMTMQHQPQHPSMGVPMIQQMTSGVRAALPTTQQIVMNSVSQALQLPQAGPIPHSISDTVASHNQATTRAKKMTMDRSAALAELSKLQEQLTSESTTPSIPNPSITSVAPTMMSDKRKIMSDHQTMNDSLLPGKKLKLGVAMPQAFPNTTSKSKLSQIESKLKREAILAAVRKQKEKEAQQQQQKAQELLTVKQNQQPQPQATPFSLHPNASVQGVQQQQESHIITQQLQPQQSYEINSVSDYIANPTSLNNTYNNCLHSTKQSLYLQQQQQQQQPSQQNPFQREIQLNNQFMGQQQQQRLHSQHLESNNAAGFPQSQQHQQLQELRNQLLPGNSTVAQPQQHQLPFMGTTTGVLDRNDSSINGSDDNVHLRGGTNTQYM